MFMPGPMELVIIVVMLLMIGLVVLVIVRIIGWVSGSGRADRRSSPGGGFSLGHAKLSCPHCGQETTAGKPRCEHCGEDL